MRGTTCGVFGAILYLLAQSAVAQAPPSPLLAGIGGSFPVTRRAAPLSERELLGLHPKDLFKECEFCPEMVVVAAGAFVMGAPESEPGSTPDERPQHRVKFAQPFSVGRFPVTLREWDACVKANACTHRSTDQNVERESRPIGGITWEDAKGYVSWLSHVTGRTYRLLTEAEREYVTRAGTTTAFWWGDTFSPPPDERHAITELKADTASATVRTFAPNPWGLYQVHGDVYDWVEDCWNETYDGAPTDGSAWTTGNCDRHVLRGGAFSRRPQTMRSAARIWFGSSQRLSYMSVRVARSLR